MTSRRRRSFVVAMPDEDVRQVLKRTHILGYLVVIAICVAMAVFWAIGAVLAFRA